MYVLLINFLIIENCYEIGFYWNIFIFSLYGKVVMNYEIYKKEIVFIYIILNKCY